MSFAVGKKEPQKSRRRPKNHYKKNIVVNSLTSQIQCKQTCPCDGTCPRCQNNHPVQTKLTIGQPNDKYEQEADRIADEVMRIPEPVPQKKPA